MPILLGGEGIVSKLSQHELAVDYRLTGGDIGHDLVKLADAISHGAYLEQPWTASIRGLFCVTSGYVGLAIRFAN